jgi:hypothetical protein
MAKPNASLTRTKDETERLTTYREKIGALVSFVGTRDIPHPDAPPIEWMQYVSGLLATTGNAHNWASFVGCLMAKEYLVSTNINIHQFDASSKAEGAKGLDIDEITTEGYRVVADIKSTSPHKTGSRPDLGAQ